MFYAKTRFSHLDINLLKKNKFNEFKSPAFEKRNKVGGILNLVIFQAQNLSNCIDNGYLVCPSPQRIFEIVHFGIKKS